MIIQNSRMSVLQNAIHSLVLNIFQSNLLSGVDGGTHKRQAATFFDLAMLRAADAAIDETLQKFKDCDKRSVQISVYVIIHPAVVPLVSATM